MATCTRDSKPRKATGGFLRQASLIDENLFVKKTPKVLPWHPYACTHMAGMAHTIVPGPPLFFTLLAQVETSTELATANKVMEYLRPRSPHHAVTVLTLDNTLLNFSYVREK